MALNATHGSARPTTMDRNDRGANVRSLQERLAAHGFDPGARDGVYGPKTEAAVRRFQQAHGLGVDGVAGPRTAAALREAPGARAKGDAKKPEMATDSYKPAAPAGKMRDYRDIAKFAQAHGFHVTSTNGGKHNVGSAHYQGRAVDVRTRDKSAAQINQLIRDAKAAGLKVHDERRHPPGQKVWSGPHLHLEIPRR